MWSWVICVVRHQLRSCGLRRLWILGSRGFNLRTRVLVVLALPYPRDGDEMKEEERGKGRIG